MDHIQASKELFDKVSGTDPYLYKKEVGLLIGYDSDWKLLENNWTI